MKFIRNLLDRSAPLFEKGGKLEVLYPLYEAQDTFLFTPGTVTKGAAHVRDALDLKRMMITVVVALVVPVIMAMYNSGYQANVYIAEQGAQAYEGWRIGLLQALGLGMNPGSILSCFVHGALYYVPILIVTFAVGGGVEVIFSIVRKHEVNEGFLVTGMLFPLIVPPTLPLWQAAIGIIFGVFIGKEIFGGTGMNILNPALTARAFLFFAYPAQISGDKVWIAAKTAGVEGVSGATALGQLADAPADVISAPVSFVSETWTWWEAFVGTIPGSMGETSALGCLIGAAILLLTGIASWRIMLGVVIGTLGTSLLLNAVGSETNALMNMPFWWHMVLGGWAFGTVYMATEPVTAPYTERARIVYGLLIGILCILVRVVNPAFPEGVMLAILLMNVFAPLLDHVAINANIKRRLGRAAV
ncbi:MAG: NADH:ubiquinone reductase (Na(+)-transporting) subunit B [Candidatus Hydrogenedentota bacterium]